MTAQRTPYGTRASCARCGQDIEYIGRGKWQDRGAGRQCLPFIKQGSVVQPKGRHVPYRNPKE